MSRPFKLRGWCATLALLALGSLSPPALAEGAQPPAGKSREAAEARSHFERAAALYKEGNFDAALVEFSRAYELLPNYRVLFNIGQVHVELHDYVSALRAFEDYLRQGGEDLPAERREQVERDIAQMKTRVSELRIKVDVAGAELAVDGKSVGTSPFRKPILVSAGVRHLRVSKAGYLPIERELSVAGGDTPEIALTLEPAEPGAPAKSPARADVETAPHSRPLGSEAWISLGATGVFASGAVVFAVLAQAKNKDLDTELDRLPANPTAVDSTRSRLKLYAGLTDGFAVAATVSAACAIYFLASGGSDTDRPARKHAARVIPLANGLALTGDF